MAIAPTRFSRVSMGFVDSVNSIRDKDAADTGPSFSVIENNWAIGATTVSASAAELNLTDGLLATTAELNRSADLTGRVVTLVATGSITVALHEGRILLMAEVGGDAAAAFTLPEATGSGAIYKFVVGVVNTSGYTIDVATDDIFAGNIVTNSTGDSPDLSQPWPTASDSDTIILNGTTTGGVSRGDFVEVQDVLTGVYSVYGYTTSSGTELTPFSAAVP